VRGRKKKGKGARVGRGFREPGSEVKKTGYHKKAVKIPKKGKNRGLEGKMQAKIKASKRNKEETLKSPDPEKGTVLGGENRRNKKDRKEEGKELE